MPFKCFVPGCKSGYIKCMKENEKAGIRNPSIFSAPKDDQLLNKWKKMIPRQDRTLTSKDKVCELHFEEECIEKEYVTLMPDGFMHKIPRGSIILKKGSIPTIFPNLPAYLSIKTNKRKVPTSRACTSENKHRKCSTFMIMPNKICCVAGCKTGYSSKRRENKSAGIRNPTIFSAPKDDELLEKWRQIIPREERDFSSKDSICELHFEKECIERDYVNLAPDGSLLQIPKGHATLKKGSIPTIFTNLPKYLSIQTKKRTASALCEIKSSKKKHRKFDDNLGNVTDNYLQLNDNSENVIDNSPQSNDNIENVTNIPPQLNDNLENVTDISQESNDNLENIIDISPQSNDNLKNAVKDTPSQFDDFLKFAVEVQYMLSHLNSWWSILSTEDFIIFAKWNSECYAERRFVVHKDFSTKIFLRNVEVSLPIENCTTKNIAQLLQRVERLKICQNIDSRTSRCLGFLDGGRRVFCSACTKSKRNEKEAEKRKNKPGKRNILGEMKNIKRRNKRLVKKVLDLKSKLVESKYQYSQTKKEVLEAAYFLPIEERTAIKSCFSASRIEAHLVNARVKIQRENKSKLIPEDLSDNEFLETSMTDSEENARVKIQRKNNSKLITEDLSDNEFLETSMTDSEENARVKIQRKNNSELITEDLSDDEFSETSMTDSEENARVEIQKENNSELTTEDMSANERLKTSRTASEKNARVEIRKENNSQLTTEDMSAKERLETSRTASDEFVYFVKIMDYDNNKRPCN